jgi:hypothetical protein
VGRGASGVGVKVCADTWTGGSGAGGRWGRTNRKVTNYGAESEAAENNYRV